MLCIYLLLLSALSQVIYSEWIDPHDMNTNTKQSLKKSLSTGNLMYRNEECHISTKENSSLIYLKRVVNLIINSVHIDRSTSSDVTDSVEYRGQLYFNVNEDELNFLKKFSAMNEVHVDDLRKLDTILSSSLERSNFDKISGLLFSTKEKIYELIVNYDCLPVLALLVFMYIAFNLFKSNFSIWYVFRYFVFMVIIIDFMQRYQQLVKEAEEHNMNLKYSLKCDTSKMSWASYFKFMTSHEDCEKKVVSLLEVGLNQIRSVIIIPLTAAGTGMGHFGSELWRNLPFPWNMLIFPMMLIFCVIITAIVITTVNKTPIKFNIMHLFHVEFGERKQSVTTNTLDKLLDAVNHRPMWQEVKPAIDSITKQTPLKKKNKTKSVDHKYKKVEPVTKEIMPQTNNRNEENYVQEPLVCEASNRSTGNKC